MWVEVQLALSAGHSGAAADAALPLAPGSCPASGEADSMSDFLPRPVPHGPRGGPWDMVHLPRGTGVGSRSPEALEKWLLGDGNIPVSSGFLGSFGEDGNGWLKGKGLLWLALGSSAGATGPVREGLGQRSAALPG